MSSTSGLEPTDADLEVAVPERFAPTEVPPVGEAGDRPVGAARSRRSSGQPGSGPTTGGSTCRLSTGRGGSATTAVSVASPGLYALGLPVLRRRKSTFIHGIEDDAREVIELLSGHLAGTAGDRNANQGRTGGGQQA